MCTEDYNPFPNLSFKYLLADKIKKLCKSEPRVAEYCQKAYNKLMQGYQVMDTEDEDDGEIDVMDTQDTLLGETADKEGSKDEEM